MVFTNRAVIIREKYDDDGTTTGTKVYQTADGKWWKETWTTPETAQTGQIIGRLSNGSIIW